MQQINQINVNVNKDRRSFMDTENSGGSGMRLSTIYDSSSPARVQMQQSCHTNPSSVANSRTRRRTKLEKYANGLNVGRHMKDTK